MGWHAHPWTAVGPDGLRPTPRSGRRVNAKNTHDHRRQLNISWSADWSRIDCGLIAKRIRSKHSYVTRQVFIEEETQASQKQFLRSLSEQNRATTTSETATTIRIYLITRYSRVEISFFKMKCTDCFFMKRKNSRVLTRSSIHDLTILQSATPHFNLCRRSQLCVSAGKDNNNFM